MFIFTLITLLLELVATGLLLYIDKMGDNLDALVLALWSWPLLIFVIISFVGSFINRFKKGKNKKTTSAMIMSVIAVIYLLLYAVMLGFLVGTGQLPFYYFPDGF